MPRFGDQENALSGRFFMPFVLLFHMLATPVAWAEGPSCVSTHFDEKVEIDYIIDGDTVILADQRHVRLIGIDTPEIFHDGRPAEAGAQRARDYLQTLLAETETVGLQYDTERQDRHGRTLAHLYLPDGRNVQALLLQQGLAMPLFIPPSVGRAECYAEASQGARAAQRGLWALARYQPLPVTSLSGREAGFHILRGTVGYVSESRSALWVNLENNIALRITRADLAYFDTRFIQQLKGKQIEARGWLYRRNGQQRMRIRYPFDLTIIEPD